MQRWEGWEDYNLCKITHKSRPLVCNQEGNHHIIQQLLRMAIQQQKPVWRKLVSEANRVNINWNRQARGKGVTYTLPPLDIKASAASSNSCCLLCNSFWGIVPLYSTNGLPKMNHLNAISQQKCFPIKIPFGYTCKTKTWWRHQLL